MEQASVGSSDVHLTKEDRDIIDKINSLNENEIKRFNRSLIDRGDAQRSPKDRNAAPKVDDPFVGIGGWLILPTIGLLLWPIFTGVVSIAKDMSLPDYVSNAFDSYIISNQTNLEFVLTAFTIYCTVEFFRRKKYVPIIIILLIVFSMFVPVTGYFVNAGSDGNYFVHAIPDTAATVLKDIFAAFWIPYFLLSKRVKATFVR